ncbi:MAG: AAA family ATPase, partial [Chloroflexi bacterium]|nr:AAA family ATPase [Chloroflexota bacterium]
MKIEDLYIDGFGPFASKQVGPLTGSICVIHGVNEAGKSTLLAFIRMVLFGFPRQNSSTHYPPLAGGRHGGRLSLVDDAGHRYIVERFRGVRGGPVSIMTGDGAPVDQGNLSRLLGGASWDVFKNVFAFSLDELQADKSLPDADVNSQIYSAGMGAANLPQALTA